MMNAADRFSDEDRRRIGEAVAAAENRTSVEIIPVVASSSGRYDRAEDIVGLWLGLVLAAVAWHFYPIPVETTGSWSESPAVLQLLVMLLAVVVGFLVGAFVASKVGFLRRLFTPRREMSAEVEARARTVFFDNRVHHTQGATGLLLYISLLERLATVLPDEKVEEAIGADAVSSLCDQLTTALRDGDPTAALCATIESAGEKLAEPLPRADDDRNELPDALVTID